MAEKATVGDALGKGRPFPVGDRMYAVFPMLFEDVLEITGGIDEEIAPEGVIESKPIQWSMTMFFNVALPERRKRLEHYLKSYVRDAKGEAMSLKRVATDKWDMDDIDNCMNLMLRITG